jgi:hypothetical protein
MLGVGQKFPDFSLQAVVSTEKGKAFQTITDQDYKEQWKVYFFWPKAPRKNNLSSVVVTPTLPAAANAGFFPSR